jgi:hypothetical protein
MSGWVALGWLYAVLAILLGAAAIWDGLVHGWI